MPTLSVKIRYSVRTKSRSRTRLARPVARVPRVSLAEAWAASQRISNGHQRAKKDKNRKPVMKMKQIRLAGC